MVTKLKLAFQGQQLVLLRKAGIFIVALGFVKYASFSIFSVAVFLIIATVVYNRPLIHTFAFLASYITFVVLVLMMSYRLIDVPLLITFYISIGIVAYIFYGIKNYFFIHRGELRYFVQLFLSYIVYTLFFSADTSSYFSFKLFIIATILFLMWKELFSSLAREKKDEGYEARNMSPAFIAGSISLLVTESLWAISLLPLNSLSAASLAVLVQFIVSDSIMRYMRHKLFVKTVLLYITIFITLAVCIFATTSWSI